jgi:D-aminoacyl-tRNA deacylase
MRFELAIICSRADPASINIAERLLELESWEDHGAYRSSGGRCLLIHNQRQVLLRGFDKHLEELALQPEAVVFASRHESQAKLPWLGGHFTGEIAPSSWALSAAAPWGLRSLLLNLNKHAPQGFRVSAEATHHGPTDMRTPSFFAEIGSSEPQWRDAAAGEAVARAILDLKRRELPVFLGFGGGHYVQRQTSLMLSSDIAFGHLFSSYQADALRPEILAEAAALSRAGYAYIDKKSFRSQEKKQVSDLIRDLGVPLLGSREIRERFPFTG